MPRAYRGTLACVPRRLALVIVVGCAAALPASAASGPAPWAAPSDPMKRTLEAGLVPEVNEHLQYHVHSHLDVFVNGKKMEVPAGIGIDTKDPAVQKGQLPDGSLAYGGITRCPKVCISPLHTHAHLGVLHTETSKPEPNTLGQFFVEWGVRLDSKCVGAYCSPKTSVRFYVNGKPRTGDPRKILLTDKSEIAVVIGKPPKRIPATWPKNATI
jgi:hypothetical protein